MEKKRSVGVTVCGIILLVLSVPSLFLALIAMISHYYGEGLKDLSIDIGMQILFIGTPIALFCSGKGLLDLKKWGRTCAIITATILSLGLLGFGIMLLIDKDIFFSSINFFAALFFIFLIYYFTRPKVKEQFRQRSNDGEQDFA